MAETKKKTTTTKAPVEKTPLEKALEETTAKTVEKKAVKTVEKTAEKASEPAKAVKKTAGRKPAAKKELTSKLSIQFSGKSYSQEELIKIAKDVWKYDLKKKVGDLTSVELYVKPEESVVYYVFNGTETGSFNI